tara:strand:+ start:6234 stop:6440 length:207 start_codon:yes stop_codon:yes gene_type:complete
MIFNLMGKKTAPKTGESKNSPVEKVKESIENNTIEDQAKSSAPEWDTGENAFLVNRLNGLCDENGNKL